PSAPEVPSVDEAGAPAILSPICNGLWAPKGTPNTTAPRPNGALIEALADPKVRQRFAAMGQEIPPPEQLTPQALADLQKAEIKKWWPIIKAANIKVD